jgi:hypothetical protein
MSDAAAKNVTAAPVPAAATADAANNVCSCLLATQTFLLQFDTSMHQMDESDLFIFHVV